MAEITIIATPDTEVDPGQAFKTVQLRSFNDPAKGDHAFDLSNISIIHISRFSFFFSSLSFLQPTDRLLSVSGRGLHYMNALPFVAVIAVTG